MVRHPRLCNYNDETALLCHLLTKWLVIEQMNMRSLVELMEVRNLAKVYPHLLLPEE